MRFGRGSRFTTLFVLFLAVFGDGTLLTHVHNLVVPHTLCPIHGEMIHADEDEAIHQYVQVNHTAVAGQSIVYGNSKDANHHHEHCSLAIGRPTLLTRSSAYQLIEILQQVQTHIVVRSFIRQFALILLSPKTSPPQFSLV